MNFATRGEESFIDATFAMAKGGGAEIGSTKRGRGMKIMAIVDHHGLLGLATHGRSIEIGSTQNLTLYPSHGDQLSGGERPIGPQSGQDRRLAWASHFHHVSPAENRTIRHG
jgi:hypothetical protein